MQKNIFAINDKISNFDTMFIDSPSIDFRQKVNMAKIEIRGFAQTPSICTSLSQHLDPPVQWAMWDNGQLALPHHLVSCRCICFVPCDPSFV